METTAGWMRSTLSFLSLLFVCEFFGCSSGIGQANAISPSPLPSPSPSIPPAAIPVVSNKLLPQGPSSSPRTYELGPGKVVLLDLDGRDLDPSELEGLECGDRKIPYFLSGRQIKAYLSESYFSAMAPYECHFVIHGKLGKERKLAALIKIVPFAYPEEKLKVDQKRVFLSKKNLARVGRETQVLNRIYAHSSSSKLFSGAFSLPLLSTVTSTYGTKRIYNRKKKSQHLGTDFRAKVGVPVLASNSGKVVFAGELFFTGNTVIVDHGLEIFSVYAHLSKIKVQSGKLLAKGATVGLSGKTGRVNGPHLHWGVKIEGNWVDGRVLPELGP